MRSEIELAVLALEEHSPMHADPTRYFCYKFSQYKQNFAQTQSPVETFGASESKCKTICTLLTIVQEQSARFLSNMI